MNNHTRTVDVCGDILEVTWDGNTWISPHNGQQHSHSEAAMWSELTAYFRRCGKEPETKQVIEEIANCLATMTYRA